MGKWARRVGLVLALIPAVASWTYAGYAIAQQTTPRLGEENRRIIERLMAEFRGHERSAETAIAALIRQLDLMEARLREMQERQFYLILVTAGTGSMVGFDKAGYYFRRKKTGDGQV